MFMTKNNSIPSRLKYNSTLQDVVEENIQNDSLKFPSVDLDDENEEEEDNEVKPTELFGELSPAENRLFTDVNEREMGTARGFVKT